MTQKDLATASGISVPQIGRYETGLSMPRMTALVKLAHALNVRVEDLQGSESEPEAVSMFIDEGDGTVVPIAVSKRVVDHLQSEADTHHVSLNAMFIATLDVARAAMDGENLPLSEAIRNAVTFLGE
jgi:transcriptional regulator with XRE-family HTH domain